MIEQRLSAKRTVAKGSKYGHKFNITMGKHGMVLDVVIEEGNPADSNGLLPMIRRIKECYGKLPR
jgi:transposase, IS5 family